MNRASIRSSLVTALAFLTAATVAQEARNAPANVQVIQIEDQLLELHGGWAVSDSTTMTALKLPQTDGLELQNGDRLKGRLVAIPANTNVAVWLHPESISPFVFRKDALKYIKIKTQEGSPQKPTSGTVYLNGGDVLKADIHSMTTTNLSVHVPGTGELTLDRGLVRSLMPATASGSVLFDMTRVDESKWIHTHESRRWTVTPEKISTSQSSCFLGYELKTDVNQLSYHFTLDCTQYPYLNFYFLTDDPKQTSGNSYFLYFTGNNVRLKRYSRERGSSQLGSANNIQRRNGKVDIDIYVDREKRTFSFFANGSLKQTWKDSQPIATKGTSVGFYTNSNTPIAVHNLLIRKWDGRLPERAGKSAGSDSATEDSLLLANGDRVSGKIPSFADEKIDLTTSFASLSVPIENVEQVTLAGNDTGLLRGQTVKLYFFNGSILTVDLLAIGKDKVIVDHPAFGQAIFPQNYVSRVQFLKSK